MSDELPRDIEIALRALDTRAAERAARVDPEAVAARVLARLRREPAEARGRVVWMRPAVLRFAAAAVVLVAAGATVTLMVDQPPPAAAVALPVAGIDSLSTAQLEAVLEAAGEVRSVGFESTPSSATRSLDDLSEQELQTVLASLNGAG
jgi:hypothetical protein